MENLTGRTIKGYELRDLIGRGGFGVVYRAYQAAVNRDVAIKIILPQYANKPYFIRNFQFEAQLIARLEHLHIVPLYDYWRDPEGAYIVMRWLRGGNLSRMIKKNGPLDLTEASAILTQIASALQTAHDSGVIHQDLKTANILLDEQKNAYLTDFGIAKDLSKAPEEEVNGREDVAHGSPEYMAPEQILNIAVDHRSDVYGLGIVLYEMLTGSPPFHSDDDQKVLQQQLYDKLPPLQMHRPELPEYLNEVVWKATDKHPRHRYQSALEIAAAFESAVDRVMSGTEPAEALTAATREPVARPILLREVMKEPNNPYKGLQAFQEADAANFYGRSEVVERLLDRLKEGGPEGRFLAVVGPSGIGKSSVVKAGLIPALRQDALAGSKNWFISEMTPGTDPLDQLEAAILQVSTVSGVPIHELLRHDENGLSKVIEDVLSKDDLLVLVIDQFEELFTLASNDQRNQFLSLLLNSLQTPARRVIVVVTLRADFYDRPLMYPEFGELLRKRTEIILPLNKMQLRDVIVKPADNAGLSLEEGLVDQIIADISEQPGALPLLQYALRELFVNRRGTTLTRDAYTALGGVSGALTRRADELFHQLSAERRGLVRQMFLRLVTLGEGTEDTRRRVKRAELLSLGQAGMDDIIELYGRYRLLSFDNDPESRAPTVEIGHEALIRSWQRLREWLLESRDSLRLQRQLAIAATEWEQNQRDSSYLARGGRLEQFEMLQSDEDVALGENEKAYLAAGQALQRTVQRRRNLFISVLAGAALVATIASVFAFDRQQRATRARDEVLVAQATTVAERDISFARQLSITALNQAAEEFDLALLLNLAALDIADMFTTRDTQLTLLQSQPRVYRYLHGNSDFVRALAFSPDGALIASGGQDNAVRIYNTQTGAMQVSPIEVHTNWVNALEFSPDGSLIASAGQDNTVTLIDSATGQVSREPLTVHSESIWDISFSPDGTQLATASADGTVVLIDVETWTQTGEKLTGHQGTVYAVAFSPDGTALVSAGSDGNLIFWTFNENEIEREIVAVESVPVRALAFNPVGNLLITGDEAGVLRLWNVRTRQQFGEPFIAHTNTVRAVEFAPDGLRFYSAGMDGAIYIWDTNVRNSPVDALANLELLPTERPAVLALALDPQQRFVLSGGQEDRITMWSMTDRSQLGETQPAHAQPVTDLVFTSSEQLLSVENEINAESERNLLIGWALGDGSPEVMTETDLAETSPRQVVSIAISPDGQFVAKGGMGIRLFNTTTGESDGAMLDTEDVVTALAFSEDGRYLAAGGLSGSVDLWALAGNEWQQLASIAAHDDRIMHVAFSSDQAELVTGSRDTTLKRWAISEDGLREIETLTEHDSEILSAAYSPDGRFIASGNVNGRVVVHDLETDAVYSAIGHRNHVNDLAFSNDSRYVASGSRDGSIILWDISENQLRSLGEPLVISGLAAGITTVEFNPDGRFLAAGTERGDLVFWDVDVGHWKVLACRIANRNMTAEEQQQFLPDGSNQNVVCE